MSACSSGSAQELPSTCLPRNLVLQTMCSVDRTCPMNGLLQECSFRAMKRVRPVGTPREQLVFPYSSLRNISKGKRVLFYWF